MIRCAFWCMIGVEENDTRNPKPTPKTAPMTEEEWEEEVLTDALKDALADDGSIDFDKLRAQGTTMTLDELHPQGDKDDES